MAGWLVVTLVAVLRTVASSAADKVTYNDHVLPIFRNTCLNCHNPDKKKAGLDLSTYQGALQGSETGKVLESGNPGKSLLFRCVKQIEDPKMPPKGEKLTDAELAIVEKWIAGQLLESATGKAVAASNNNVEVAVVSLERPPGPPPMPGDLPLEPLVRTSRKNALIALAASPWAPLVAVGGQKQIILYNIETLEPLGVLPFPEGFPAIIRFSRNGQLLLTGGGLGGKSGKVVLWDIKTGDRVATLGNEFDQVLAADLSADQQFVALGGPNKLVKIYATKDGKLLHSIKKHTDWVTGIAYSPDGKYLASADRNGGIQIWEASTAKEYNALPGHKVMVTSLAFMTGVVASSSEDGTIKLWDVKEGKEIKSWNAHTGGTAWVDFTPDGRLVSCGRDRIAKIWDQTGKELGKTAEPFPDIALRAALNSDRIIAGDWSGEIRVCSLDGKRVGELTANPRPISEQLGLAQKRLSDAETRLATVQQHVIGLEAKVRAEKLAAEEKRKAEADAADEKVKLDKAAFDSARARSVELAKRLAEENGELAELRKARDVASDADRPAAQAKVDALKTRIAKTETDLADARTAAEVKGAVKTQPAGAPSPQIAELTKKLEQQNAEVARLREIRSGKTEGTPEYAEANSKVQAKKAEIAQTETALAATEKNPALAVAKATAAEEELAAAKSALAQVTAEITQAKGNVEKWSRAQAFMAVHNARQHFAEKRARYDELVALVKEAMVPAEKAQAELAAAEKAAAAAPGHFREQETLLAEFSHAAEALSKFVGSAEALVTAKECEAKELNEPLEKAAATAADLQKKLEQQNVEVAKLREARATQAAGSAQYAEADAKVQAKKAEIAQNQSALQIAQTKGSELKPKAESVRAELAKAREALEKSRADAKAATEKVALAEKALADARKQGEEATAAVARLGKETPAIVQKAEATKGQVAEEAASAAKELETVKAELDRVQAEFQKRQKG